VADAECITVAAERLYQKTLPKLGDGAVEIIVGFWSVWPCQ
jgi:hypothetical protein